MFPNKINMIKQIVICLFIAVLFVGAYEICVDANEMLAKQYVQDKSIEELNKALGQLKKDQKESILVAKDRFMQLFPPGSKNTQEGFRIFRQFYYDVISEVDRAFYGNKEMQHLLSEMAYQTGVRLKNPIHEFKNLKSEEAVQFRKLHKKEIDELVKYENYGITFDNGEGIWYLNEDPQFLISHVLLGYDFELKEYILFNSKELKQRLAEDAGLLISWEQLRKRIIRWEEFASKHPHLMETQTEVKKDIYSLIRAYLYGVDNTPAFDYDTKKLNNDLRKSYEAFLNENKTSSYYPIIKSAYRILKKHNFYKNDELFKFYEKVGIKK